MPREPAWRVFAAELNSSKHYIKATEPKTPSYVITPLGGKVSRVFIVGVLTGVRVISDDIVKARVVDQTGAFYVFAGKYQPQTRQILESTKVPQFVAVVGKTNVYQPEEEQMYISVVPERIKIVDSVLRDYWVFDTAKKLKLRIEAMKEALNMTEPSVQKIAELGFSQRIADGIMEAIKYYNKIDVERYTSMLKDALKHLLPEYRELGYELPNVEEEDENSGDDDAEDQVLTLIDELDEGNGASYDELLERLQWDKEKLDTVLDNLKDKGEIYEPRINKLKRM